MKRILTLTVVALIFSSYFSYSQDNCTFDQNTITLDTLCPVIKVDLQFDNYVLKARDGITFKPGFSIGRKDLLRKLPSVSASFTAKIDHTLANQITTYSNNTYTPNDTAIIDKTNFIPGTIGGSVDVSPTGAASYQIPIQVSPGSNGMQPNLSIVYSSQSGNGLLGWGWNLAGLSSISRVGKIKYYDNKFEPVLLTNTDAFALDGVRLIGDATSGVYYPANNPYTKVTLINNVFTVTTQDGMVMEYGSVSNGNNSQVFTTNSTTPISYYINKIKDPNGNYIEYFYAGDKINSDYRISEIKYTGSGSKEPYNSIKFYYEKRNDISYSYIAGGGVSNQVVLQAIKVICEGSISKEYTFKYITDLYSKLYTISLTADGVKYNPTVVNWGETTNYAVSHDDTNFGSLHSNELKFGDFNGDGFNDILNYNDENRTVNIGLGQKNGNTIPTYSFNLPSTSATLSEDVNFRMVDSVYYTNKDIQIFDYNNDGKDDILFHYIKYTVTYYNAKYSNTTSYVSCKKQDIVDRYTPNGTHVERVFIDYLAQPWQRVSGTPEPTLARFSHFYIDYNADGLVERITTKDGAFFYCTGLASSNFPVITNSVDDLRPIDFDGDGQTEFLALSETGWGSVWKFNGTTFVNKYSERFLGLPANLFTGDFNGDGKSDYFSYISNEWTLYYSTGTDFRATSIINLSISQPAYTGTKQSNINLYSVASAICVDDINSDGKADITQTVDGSVRIYVANGISFDKVLTYNSLSSSNNKNVFIQWVDLNNDGVKELIAGTDQYSINQYGEIGDPLSPQYKKLTFTNGALGSKLYVNSITDGLSNKFTFTYTDFSDNRLFTTSFPKPALPLVLVRGSLKVVSQLTRTSTGCLPSTTTYVYNDGYANIDGLGFLGFKQFVSQNTESAISNTSKFEYTIPGLTGVYSPWLKEVKIQNDSGSISTQTYIMSKISNSTNPKLFRPVVSSSTSTDHLKSISTTTTNGYNSDQGRHTYQKVVTDGWIVETTNAFESAPDGGTRIISNEIKKTHDGDVHTSTTLFGYAGARVLLTKTAMEQGETTSVTTYGVNSWGNVVSESVTAGGITHSTSCVYDENGRFVVQSTDALGNISKANYRSTDGAVLWTENSLNQKTTYSYSISNGSHAVVVNSPDGNVTKSILGWAQSGSAMYSSVKLLNGKMLQTTYFNAIGQKVKEEYAGFKDAVHSVDYNYKADGALDYEKLSDITPSKAYSYDSYGRLEKVTGLNTDMSYSYNSKAETVVDNITSINQTKNFDGLGFVTNVKSTLGDVSYFYWASGKVKEIRAADGVSTMEYDNRGNQTKLIDPSSGTTNYTYNGFNQLKTQTDAKGQTITCTYYPNGLLQSKTGTNLNETYTYDESAGKVGRLLSVTRNGVTESYTYDNLGRVVTITTTGNGKTFTTTNQYNSLGQLYRVVQPTGITLEYWYDNAWNNTHIYSIDNATGVSTLIWEGFKNPQQQWESYKLGENLATKFVYNPATLYLKQIKSGTLSNETSIQNLGFEFNAKGQLEKRTEGSNKDSLVYDGLNRLIKTINNNQNTYSVSYSGNGNINNTSIAGDYTYGIAGKPHTVSSVVGPAGYSNPNSIILETSSTFNVDNRIAEMSNSKFKNEFTYGPSGERFMVDHYEFNNKVSSKMYVGNSEFILDNSGNIVTRRTMIYAPTGICAVYQDSASVKEYFFIHTDYLGSWLKITDKNGNIKNRYSYDAWGRPRNPNNWELLPISITNALVNLSAMQPRFDRGYTGHEHMAGFGLINMNGRLYDPYLQRFLSPDIFVQFPNNGQSYNRYSYCLNNPMAATDPTGWLTQSLLMNIYQNIGKIPNNAKFNFSNGGIESTILLSSSTNDEYVSLQGLLSSWGAMDVPILQVAFAAQIDPVYIYGNKPKPKVPSGQGGDLALAPENTDAFDGFWGKARFFFLGPNVGNARYDMNGKYLGPALVGGIAPAPGIKGGYSVYQGIRNGKVVYWGLTNNFSRRTAEHAGRFDDIIEVFPNLTRSQARGLEQLMIDKYGIQNLENIRNGIGVSNPNMMQYFQDAVRVLLGL